MSIMLSKELFVYFTVSFMISAVMLKVGFAFIHSGIYILIVLSPAYFYIENNGDVSNPSLRHLAIYMSTQALYYFIIMKVYIFFRHKLNKHN